MKKLALVTGGTRGIGAAISIELQKAGYSVIANYANNEQNAFEFNRKTSIPIYKWDVADFEACQNSIKRIEQDFNASIDILVNNAGITRDKMMHKMSLDSWQEVIATNLSSCFNMSRLVIGKMRENKFGRIVNISSINAHGQVGQVNYSAAKAGLIGLTKSLALEVANQSVTVNAIAPGYIKTDMTKAVDPELVNNITQKIPVGRLGEPEDIARAVLFLVAKEAGFITGETLAINGGHRMD